MESHEVYSIEEVEGIKAQVQVDALSDTSCLLQRKVSVRVAGVEEAVRGLVPFRSESRKREITTRQCATRADGKDSVTDEEVTPAVLLCVGGNVWVICVVAVRVVVSTGWDVF